MEQFVMVRQSSLVELLLMLCHLSGLFLVPCFPLCAFVCVASVPVLGQHQAGGVPGLRTATPALQSGSICCQRSSSTVCYLTVWLGVDQRSIAEWQS